MSSEPQAVTSAEISFKKGSLPKAQSKVGKKLKDPLSRPKTIPLPSDWSKCDPGELTHPSLYINRELSWCQFNMRVLDQAFDAKHPLLERVKFFAIVASNLDEFFMIRIATLLRIIRSDLEKITPDGLSTTEAFWAIHEEVEKMMAKQRECWNRVLRPLLAKESIEILEPSEYTPEVRKYLANYFKTEIFPILTPLAFDPSHPFPHISNLSLNFAVEVRHNEQIKFARVKIPPIFPRFIALPEELSRKSRRGRLADRFVFVEDVIKINMGILFPETQVVAIYVFRVIRDTDIEIREDEASDLLESVSEGLKQIRYGEISRLEIEEKMPQRILEILIENFHVPESAISRTHDRMGYADWMTLMKINRPRLKDSLLKPFVLFDTIDSPDTIFEQIKYEDYFLHHPYDSFSALETFLKAAVNDPLVIAIKMTLYRVDADSPIVELLTNAREIGKQVAVLVELKARFDEESNILWAQRMEAAGVHMVYGVLRLKTHCKLCLIVRKEAEGIRRYVHVGTGNYNQVTSRIYTDLGIFTAHRGIVEDVSQVFNYLTGYSNQKSFRNLLVAPLSFRSGIIALIEKETELAKAGHAARLIFKVNQITDPTIIQTLYKASQAGVKVDLIVRGICCLRPNIAGISDNIRVISVIGRFLEHSRIYYFQNKGEEEIYIGSADLMERNLDRRVEVVTPVYSRKIKSYLKTHVLDIMLQDNQQASELQTNGEYVEVSSSSATPVSTQHYLLDWHGSRLN